MKKITSTHAKTHFSDVLTKSQREPVVIEKHNQPVAVVISFEAYQDYQKNMKADQYWGELADKSGKMLGKKKSEEFFEMFGE